MKIKKTCFNEVCLLGKKVYSTAQDLVCGRNAVSEYIENIVKNYATDIIQHSKVSSLLTIIREDQPNRDLLLNEHIDNLREKYYDIKIYPQKYYVLQLSCLLTNEEYNILQMECSALRGLATIFTCFSPEFYKEILTANWRLGKIFAKDGTYKTMKPQYSKYVLPTESVDFIVATYFDLVRYGYKYE